MKEPAPPAVAEFIFDTVRSDNFAKLPLFDTDQTIRWFDRVTDPGADPALMTILSAAMLQERFRL
jgi:hypothetical protein